MDAIQLKQIRNLNFNDIFFDSLRESYPGFDEWLEKKGNNGEYAYVLEQNGLQGFLYLKEEYEDDSTITPRFCKKKRLKVGTFKINPHGTKLGERFIKIIIDEMMNRNIGESYVTVFEYHDALINLFKKYGFTEHGIKTSVGKELVFVKKIDKFNLTKDFYKDYPLINVNGTAKHLLAIYPVYHTKMFPGSRLKTEKNHYIEDISVTNNIEKVYLSGANLSNYKKGDIIVIYRTQDQSNAYYSSVATTLCTVVEVRSINSFLTYGDFYKYCKAHSVFTDGELQNFWESRRYPTLIKMLYNKSLNKRIIRRDLIEKVGINQSIRWTTVDLSDEQFSTILKLGDVSESFIID